MVISIYLGWVSLTGDQAMGCGIESGCGAVLSSRWAYFLGVPVSLGAVLIHGLVLACTITLSSRLQMSHWSRAWSCLAFAAVVLLSVGVWFVALQVLAVGSLCAYCLTAHALGGVVGVLVLGKIVSGRVVLDLSNPMERVLPGRFLPAGIVGFSAVLLVAAGQLVFRPKSYDVQAVRPKSVGSSTATTVAITSSPAAPSVPAMMRPMTLADGMITFDLAAVPVIGSLQASNVVVHLFDYSCKHCRALHPLLTKVVHGLSNQVAVALLSAPLDMACNPLVKAPIPDHTNACFYAQCGLAVWKTDPAKLAEFDDWIFAPEHPPLPDLARAEAIRLVGADKFEAAMKDPGMERQMSLGVRLLEANHRQYRKSRLPQLIMGTNIIAGPVTSEQELRALFSLYMNLQ